MLTKKSLAIVKSGSGEIANVLIEPGVLVADVKKKLGLDSYVLTRPNSNKVFADGQALYPVVEDGEQLVATKETKVGSNFPTFLFINFVFFVCAWLLKRKFGRKHQARMVRRFKPKASRAVQARNVSRTRVICTGVTRGREASDSGPDGPIRVTPDSRPIWQRKGWKKTRDVYHGFYQTFRGAWSGSAVRRWKGRIDFFILNPPPNVLSGLHSKCFKGYGNGLFWIHIYPAPQDVSSGILAVERVLEESLI